MGDMFSNISIVSMFIPEYIIPPKLRNPETMFETFLFTTTVTTRCSLNVIIGIYPSNTIVILCKRLLFSLPVDHRKIITQTRSLHINKNPHDKTDIYMLIYFIPVAFKVMRGGKEPVEMVMIYKTVSLGAFTN